MKWKIIVGVVLLCAFFAGCSITRDTVDIVFIYDTTYSMRQHVAAQVYGIDKMYDILGDGDEETEILYSCVTFGDVSGDSEEFTHWREEDDGEYEYEVAKNDRWHDDKDPFGWTERFHCHGCDLRNIKMNLTLFLSEYISWGGADKNENVIGAIDFTRADPGENTNPEGSFQEYESFEYKDKTFFILMTYSKEFHTPEDPGDSARYYGPGGPYGSPIYNTLEDEIEKLKRDGIVVYVIAHDTDEYRSLAEETGGIFTDIKYGMSIPKFVIIAEDIKARLVDQ